jgi:hypothetical protein
VVVEVYMEALWPSKMQISPLVSLKQQNSNMGHWNQKRMDMPK